MNKGGKGVLYFGIFVFILAVLVLSTLSAGLFDSFRARITGKATSGPVTLNITIAGSNTPQLFIDNTTMTSITNGPAEGPTVSDLEINVTAYDADGFTNLNMGSLTLNFTKSGEVTRSNSSCTNTLNYSSYYSNFTCVITIYWYDGTGTWNVGGKVADADTNNAYNQTQNFFVGATDGFVMAPTTLTWSGISAGTTNKGANQNMTLNNTGNVNKFVEINATDLRGEINSTYALWAENFTTSNIAGCEGIPLYTNHTFKNITTLTLPKGDFTINNLTAGQEEVVTCLEQAGTELIAQSYSTANEGAWTIRIVTNT